MPLWLLGVTLGLSSFCSFSHADTGRLLATGGATSIEGAGGGGIVPWALISGLGSEDEWGITPFYSHLGTGGYSLSAAGVGFDYHNRLEVSLAHQSLNVDLNNANINTAINQNILGIKVRLFGDAIFGQDSWVPQVAAGIEYKQNDNFNSPTSSALGTLPGIPKGLGAVSADGTDYYLAATKVFLDGFLGRNVLLNGTVRMTKANQMGLLGFGGPTNNSYQLEGEVSAGIFLDQGNHALLGYEYRQNPNNGLSYVTPGLQQGNYQDVFLAYIPTKTIALVAAYTQLGALPLRAAETGPYFSIQGSF